MTYDLPVPPTTNGLYKNVGRRRAKTEAYKDWERDAGLMLRRQGVVAFVGRAELLIEIDETASTANADISNRIKAVEDLLVNHGVLRNDSKPYVKTVQATWADGIGACRVTVKEAA